LIRSDFKMVFRPSAQPRNRGWCAYEAKIQIGLIHRSLTGVTFWKELQNNLVPKISRERDVWEAAVIRAALDLGTPLLGVCRGMQLLNVVLGGTLVQHIDGHTGGPGEFGTHTVTPVDGTLLARLAPRPHTVPTYHHQAVDRLGAGLTVSARADDGTVEAIEAIETAETAETADTGGRFVLGVQWHPEAGTDRRLVQGLLAAAEKTAVSDR